MSKSITSRGEDTAPVLFDNVKRLFGVCCLALSGNVRTAPPRTITSKSAARGTASVALWAASAPSRKTPRRTNAGRGEDGSGRETNLPVVAGCVVKDFGSMLTCTTSKILTFNHPFCLRRVLPAAGFRS